MTFFFSAATWEWILKINHLIWRVRNLANWCFMSRSNCDTFNHLLVHCQWPKICGQCFLFCMIWCGVLWKWWSYYLSWLGKLIELWVSGFNYWRHSCWFLFLLDHKTITSPRPWTTRRDMVGSIIQGLSAVLLQPYLSLLWKLWPCLALFCFLRTVLFSRGKM